MLRIGEFSQFSRITVRMLRHYDQEGVLKPAEQDPQTGYRLYAVQQLEQARRITALRDVGFGVRDIKRLLAANSDELSEELRMRRHAADEEVARAQAQRDAVDKMLRMVERGGETLDHAFEVRLVTVPAYDVVSLRMALPSYHDESLAWKRLGELMQQHGITPSDPYTEFCVFPECDAVDGVEVEVVVATDAQRDEGTTRDAGGLRLYRSDPLPQAASMLVCGPYELIADASIALAGWLDAHPTLRSAGDMREIAHRGPWNANDASDYLTELIIPVEPRT